MRYAEGISSVEGDAKAALEAQAPKRVAIRFAPRRDRDLGPPQAGRDVLTLRYPGASPVLQGDAIATLPLRHETDTLRTHRRPAVLALALALGGPATGAPPPPAPSEFFGIGPQTPLTEKRRRIHEGGRDRRRADGRSPGPRSRKSEARRLQLGGPRPGRRNRRPRGPQGPALPLRHAALARPKADDAAGRQRPGRKRRGRRSSAPRSNATGPAASSGPSAPRRGQRRQRTSRPGSRARLPIRTWQIWNEANFFYFALPASPSRYAKLVKISSQAIKAVDPGAKVILSGLFAKPTRRLPEGKTGGRVPRRPLPGPRPEELLRRHRAAPLRGGHRNARRKRRGIPRSDREQPRPGRRSTSPRWAGGRRRTSRRSPSSRARRARSASCAAPTDTCSRTAPGSRSGRSTGSPGRTSRATATSATRSASSAKGGVQAEALMAGLRRDQPRIAPSLEVPAALKF